MAELRPFFSDNSGRLYHGDCLEVMKTFKDDTFETMITDPPYGLSFMGKKWDYDVPSVDVWKECLRVLKPGATTLIFAGSRTQHRMAVNVEDAGFILKDTIMWIYGSGFPKSTDISKQLDKIAGAEREVIGKYTMPIDSDAGNAGKILRSVTQEGGCFGLSAEKTGTLLTAPATNEAKVWNGWGTALKPAYEPILVAMKPNDGTYAQNALKHGVAGLNIDGGRVAYQDSKDYNRNSNFDRTQKTNTLFWEKGAELKKVTNKGRFPANIILNEEAGRLLDEQSGILKSGTMKPTFTDSLGYHGGNGYIAEQKASQGGASRFFYCAKASKSERGGENAHPTVKPISLMNYLCTLTKTPTGGTVLDPFAGSATTGLACINTERKYVLIEREEDYCQIGSARLSDVKKQLSIFDLINSEQEES